MGGDRCARPGRLAYADGREVYRFAAGVRRVDGERSWPMTVDSRFRMASVSKMFTVFTLMELAEAGSCPWTTMSASTWAFACAIRLT